MELNIIIALIVGYMAGWTVNIMSEVRTLIKNWFFRNFKIKYYKQITECILDFMIFLLGLWIILLVGL